MVEKNKEKEKNDIIVRQPTTPKPRVSDAK
jgi:hypothetical protein